MSTLSAAFAGIAAVGFVLESLDVPTDNLAGVSKVVAGAVIGALAWAIYARLEPDQDRRERAGEAARSFVRLFLAFQMMRYGVAKLVGMQFYPRYYQLDTRPADLTPMALAWTFFARSFGYQAVGGILEVASALLLCFRRTAVLGACLMLPVMVNIVLMDFFFGVPVLLFSSIYLAMALHLIAPDARRFAIFFLTDGPVPARATPARAAPGARRKAATAVLVTLVIVLPAADIAHKAYRRGIFTRDALEGAWIVHAHSGVDLPGTTGQLEKVYFEKGGYGFLRIGGRRLPFKTEVDEAKRTVRLHEVGGPPGVELSGTFVLQGEVLRLEGVRGEKRFAIELARDPLR
jgi:hypothetical protein